MHGFGFFIGLTRITSGLFSCSNTLDRVAGALPR